jgi:hypothetical protein
VDPTVETLLVFDRLASKLMRLTAKGSDRVAIGADREHIYLY